MPTPQNTSASRSDFGLVGWLESTRVSLPLKGVEARFEVAGEVAHVELDQIYHQTAARPLDCQYSFPLPAGAAVHRCELHVNGRVISARVEELRRARELYDEARQSGRRASLMEAVRPNFFTLDLANVQPDDLVVVRLAYVQILERVGSERRLRIPFCPGVRYVPGHSLKRPNVGPGTEDDTDHVSDASRISPPRIDALHPDAAYLSVSGVLQLPGTDGARLTTHSHRLQTTREQSQLRLELDSKGSVPDQDFLLGWELDPAQELRPCAWTSSRAGWNYSLIELRAPTARDRVSREPLDVYFLLDRSGSMQGTKWSQACVALGRIMDRLTEGDRVQVTWFEISFGDLVSRPTGVEVFRGMWTAAKIEEMGTAGGTELLPALDHVLSQVNAYSAERKPVVVLVTDGQVANEAAVTGALQNHPRLVVHTFGIDTAVNDALLTQMAHQQRGRCVLLRPDEDIAAAIGRLGALLASPVVTDLQTPVGWETADGPLPDLYAGETATAVLRGHGPAPQRLLGWNPEGQEVTLNLAVQALTGPAVSLLWAKRRITLLEARQELPAALALARKFNLICQGAAFVAWDEVEKVPAATEQIIQPALELGGELHYSDRMVRDVGFMEEREDGPRLGHVPGGTFADESDTLSEPEIAEPKLVNRQREVGGELSRPSRMLTHMRSPRPASEWAHAPMFLVTWGPEVVALLTGWLDGLGALRRRLAEWRLRKLIAAVRREINSTPEDQLREFAHRLDTLLGGVGTQHEALERIRQAAGWRTANVQI